MAKSGVRGVAGVQGSGLVRRHGSAGVIEKLGFGIVELSVVPTCSICAILELIGLLRLLELLVSHLSFDGTQLDCFRYGNLRSRSQPGRRFND
jgi:hypothetical protein